MRIKRKLFTSADKKAQNPPKAQDESMTSKDMQLEQMKLQRQLMQTQRVRQRIEAQERRDETKRIMQLQKMEQQRDFEEDKQRIRVKNLEKKDNISNSLYKSKPHPVAPVSMK